MTELPRIFSEKLPGVRFHTSARWADHTSMGAGLAEFFLAEPDSMDDLFSVIAVCRAAGVPVFPLGGGTNLIGSDSPLEVCFLKLGDAFRQVRREGAEIHAGAGMKLSALLDFAAEQGLGGASGLGGIPGTVGGARRMNAGANGREIADFLSEVEFIREGVFYRKSVRRAEWHYRTSPLPEDCIVTGAVFRFFPVRAETEREQLAAERRRRAAVTPRGRSAGSVFRNPSGALPAGRLLERAGAKRLSAGEVTVSPEHANWIVNHSKQVSESDCAALVSQMALMVRAECGVALNMELRFVNMETKKMAEASARPLNILLLKGGTSAEREVSLISGAAVAAALREAGHNVKEYDITRLEVTEDMRAADVIYPVLHGGFGEDGSLQKMLEDAGLKFVGSGSRACIDLMDKVVSKQIMERCGIRTPGSIVVDDPSAPFPAELGLPLIVKPPKEGSTFGLSLVNSESEWRAALELAFRYDSRALVEQYIDGVESTVGILNGKALPLVEIRYPGKLYDYDAKYTHALGETEYICPPAGISEKAQAEAQEFALKFYHASGARDMLRVDVLISRRDGSVWVLEGNTLPGCTPSSLLPKAALTAGITFPEMCAMLACAAAER